MSKTKISTISKNLGKIIDKHSPEILIGIGITGMLTTTVMAVQATPKALRLLDERKSNDVEDLNNIEIVKTTWKCYIPAAVTGSLSIACIIGANSVNSKRNAALATAYTLSETALKEYKDKVHKVVGDEKEEEIREAIVKDKLKNNPVEVRNIVITEKGNTLCFDAISGRYFKSDIMTIEKSVNELNRTLLNESTVSLNDLYYELGLDNTLLGDSLGWNVDKGLIEITFDTQLATDDTPCVVLIYSVAPMYDYQ